MPKKNRPEEQLQKAVKQLFDSALPPDAIAWHTPNQRGTRKLWENKLMKALGVVAGIPDFLVLWRGALLGIELKAPGEYPTKNQRETQRRLTTAGAICRTCRSQDEVSEFMAQIMGDQWRAQIARRADLVKDAADPPSRKATAG